MEVIMNIPTATFEKNDIISGHTQDGGRVYGKVLDIELVKGTNIIHLAGIFGVNAITVKELQQVTIRRDHTWYYLPA